MCCNVKRQESSQISLDKDQQSTSLEGIGSIYDSYIHQHSEVCESRGCDASEPHFFPKLSVITWPMGTRFTSR